MKGEAPPDRKRIADLAILAPVFIFFLLVPPLIGLFATSATVFGAPLILVYLFGVWLIAIVLASLLARMVRRLENDPRP